MADTLWRIATVFVFLVIFNLSECSRYRGGGKISRPSYPASPTRRTYTSRPSYHTARSSYRPVTVTVVRPRSTPTHRLSTPNRPVTTPTSRQRSTFPSNRPITEKPISRPVSTRPLATSNNGKSEYDVKPSAPVGSVTNVKPVASAPLPPGAPYPIHPPPYTPNNYGHAPPAYSPSNNPAGYGPPPAYNAYNSHPQGGYQQGGYYPQGGYQHQGGYYPQGGYHQGSSYPQGGYHPQGAHGGVTVINNNVNHNYGGGGFGGGFGGYSLPSYHYSSFDTGSGALGFFLGYSLGKLTSPTLSYANFGGGYSPRYDHYTVHHYYHNKESVPKESIIQPNAIVGCFGDSGSICPANTTSLCTSNGAILCVASATTTVPCTDNVQQNCVKTEVPCVNGTVCPDERKTTEVSIPCVSTAKVIGNITYVNNTIIVNTTNIYNNGTLVNSTSSNSTITSETTTQATTSTILNVTLNALETTTVSNLNVTPVYESVNRTRRDAVEEPVNEFCVTILALPAERKATEGEKIVKTGGNVISKFLVKAFGLD